MWRVMMRKFLLTTLLILTITCSVAFASVDNLKFDGFIADEAGLFKPASIKNMNAQFYDLQKKKNVTVAVVTLKNAEGKDLEALGNKILEDYNIGNQNRGDGILFLLTDEEKLFHIVLGKMFVNAVTSEQVGAMLQSEIVPDLKNGKIDEGLVRGALMLVDIGEKFNHYDVVINASLSQPIKEKKGTNLWWLLLFPVLFGACGWYFWANKSNSKD